MLFLLTLSQTVKIAIDKYEESVSCFNELLHCNVCRQIANKTSSQHKCQIKYPDTYIRSFLDTSFSRNITACLTSDEYFMNVRNNYVKYSGNYENLQIIIP
jgi:hypothetical protein